MQTSIQPELLDPPAAAKFLGVSAGTLAVWRCTRRYRLNYIKLGSKIRYDAADLVRFIESRRVTLDSKAKQ